MLRYITQGLLVISVSVVVLMMLALIMLRLFGGQLLAVQSNSMQPVFAAGDALIVWPAHHLQTGQIVSYRNPTGDNTIVSHRIVSIGKKTNTITTLGDAQKGQSVSVPSEEVLGNVVAVVPKFGKLLAGSSHPIALGLLVYTPAIVFLYRELRRVQSHFMRLHYQEISRR